MFAICEIQGGNVSTPFTGTPYRIKYFKYIPKEINQEDLNSLDVGFLFLFHDDY